MKEGGINDRFGRSAVGVAGSAGKRKKEFNEGKKGGKEKEKREALRLHHLNFFSKREGKGGKKGGEVRTGVLLSDLVLSG